MTTGQFTWRMIRYDPGLFLANFASWTVVHVTPLILGLLMRMFFDRLSGKAPAGFTVWTIIAFIAVNEISRQGVMLLGVWVWVNLWQKLLTLLRTNLLDWLVQGPGSRRLPDSPGEAISRFRDDLDESLRVLDRIIDGLGLASFTVLALCIMLHIDTLVTLVAIPLLLVIVAIVQWVSSRITRFRRAAREAAARVTAFIGEMFNSVQAVKVDSADASVIDYFAEINEHRRRAALKDNLLSPAHDVDIQRRQHAGYRHYPAACRLRYARGAFYRGRFCPFHRLSAARDHGHGLHRRYAGAVQEKHRLAGTLERAAHGAPDDTLSYPRTLYLDGEMPGAADHAKRGSIGCRCCRCEGWAVIIRIRRTASMAST